MHDLSRKSARINSGQVENLAAFPIGSALKAIRLWGSFTRRNSLFGLMEKTAVTLTGMCYCKAWPRSFDPIYSPAAQKARPDPEGSASLAPLISLGSLYRYSRAKRISSSMYPIPVFKLGT